MKSNGHANLVDAIAEATPAKDEVERHLARIALGIVTALRDPALSRTAPAVANAVAEFFVARNYEAARRRRLGKDVREMFEWGLELPNVARLAPDGLDESLDAIASHARRVLSTSVVPRRPLATDSARPARGRRLSA